MTDREKIRAEVESIKAQYPSAAKTLHMELENLIDFIDSLPEEQGSDDLEKAAKSYMPAKARYMLGNDSEVSATTFAFDFGQMFQMFKNGAQWQKQQMMKDAVDAEVGYGKGFVIPLLGCILDEFGLDYDDKIKLIIVKED